jgi:hypothetical protein
MAEGELNESDDLRAGDNGGPEVKCSFASCASSAAGETGKLPGITWTLAGAGRRRLARDWIG